MTNHLESGPAKDTTSAPLTENMVEDVNKTSYYIQATFKMPVPVASALNIFDILLSSDQPDFLGYYDL